MGFGEAWYGWLNLGFFFFLFIEMLNACILCHEIPGYGCLTLAPENTFDQSFLEERDKRKERRKKEKPLCSVSHFCPSSLTITTRIPRQEVQHYEESKLAKAASVPRSALEFILCPSCVGPRIL